MRRLRPAVHEPDQRRRLKSVSTGNRLHPARLAPPSRRDRGYSQAARAMPAAVATGEAFSHAHQARRHGPDPAYGRRSVHGKLTAAPHAVPGWSMRPWDSACEPREAGADSHCRMGQEGLWATKVDEGLSRRRPGAARRWSGAVSSAGQLDAGRALAAGPGCPGAGGDASALRSGPETADAIGGAA